MATILCVDDDASVGSVLTTALERVGHRALHAPDVPQALQALTVANVDLIISDSVMPGLSGLQFLDVLRSEAIDVPLIMLTSHASIGHAVTAIKAGAVDYISKPVDLEQLRLAVDQALAVIQLRREKGLLRREVMTAQSARTITLDSPNLVEAERVLIEHALRLTGGNRTRAARLLGISIRTLRNKLNRERPQT